MSEQLAFFDPLELPLYGPKRRRYAHLDELRAVLETEAPRLRRLRGVKPTDHYSDGWRFRDAFQEAYPEWAHLDVLTHRGKAVTLGGKGQRSRLRFLRPINEVAKEVKPNAEAGQRVWSRLGDEWLQMYDIISSDDHTAAKVWLWKTGKPVELCEAVYSFAFWIALSYLRGEDLRGGAHTIELRRAR